jgi:hypothetical protein
MGDATRLLSSLADRIRHQLAYEYHSEEAIQEAMETMTVARLLEMLSYMDLTALKGHDDDEA